MNTQSRVLVTGGAGFIGSHLCDQLIAAGHQVVALDDLSTGRVENIAHLAGNANFAFVRGSILDAALLQTAMDGAVYVFHQAAIASVPRSVKDPLATHEANATGTLRVLLAARQAGVQHVVFASSSSVYGDTPTLPKREDMPLKPLSPYAVSKLASEAYCAAFTECYGLQTTALRYFNVYGPRQDPNSEYAAVIPKFIRAATGGQPLTIYGDGLQTRDFTYVKDVVAANIFAAAHGLTGSFNVGRGDTVTINALAELVLRATRSSSTVTHLPARPGDIYASQSDPGRLSQAGFVLRTTLAEGIARTLARNPFP